MVDRFALYAGNVGVNCVDPIFCELVAANLLLYWGKSWFEEIALLLRWSSC